MPEDIYRLNYARSRNNDAPVGLRAGPSHDPKSDVVTSLLFRPVGLFYCQVARNFSPFLNIGFERFSHFFKVDPALLLSEGFKYCLFFISSACSLTTPATATAGEPSIETTGRELVS